MRMANPNPSPETRFGAENGNKPNGGKTSEQRRLEYEAAEMAAKIRHAALSSIMERIEAGEDALEHVGAQTLKLFKDSEDRAHGTPHQTKDITSDGKAVAMPTQILLVSEGDDDDYGPN